jgi:hypothetical protein
MLRRMMTQHQPRDIDPIVLRSTLDKAVELNREERMRFHVVTDLTTAVHIGDLLIIDFETRDKNWKLVELKDGRINSILLEAIQEGGGAIDLEVVGAQLGKHAVRQAQRIIRQQSRMDQLSKLRDTDTGVDAVTGRRIQLSEKPIVSEDYDEEVRTLISRARTSGIAIQTIDDCLRLVAIDSNVRSIDFGAVLHIFYHLQNRDKDCRLSGTPEEAGAEFKEFKAVKPFATFLH